MYKTIVYPKSYIVWDLETDGFNGKENHILEIGMFNVYNGEVIDKKRWVLNHGVEIKPEITAINGMTKEIIDAEGMDPSKGLEEFLEYVRNSDANITHNGVKFDIVFLVEHVRVVLKWDDERLEKLQKHLNRTSIDTAVLFKGNLIGCKRNWNESFITYANRCMKVIAKGKYNLGVCCDEFQIDRTKVTQHRALGDVELTNELYKVMISK